ncbi:hypothetical protein A9Q81_11655 [Gammaproteobacteria bacterium 42_54_T18]|nr:hypothetical protein A9Q81_11655 [Gammaproteobacteria bacterium 42_54_T18]
MSAININAFSGEVPRTSARHLGPTQATKALNARLDSGELRPWKAPLSVTALAKPGEIQSIYRWGAVAGDENSGFWFHWTTDVDVMRGQVKSDTIERTFFTGDGVPKMTYSGIATEGGSALYPNVDRPLGLPIPPSTTAAVLTGTIDPEANEADDKVTRGYAVTFVTSIGEEGPPSLISQTLDWLPGQTVDLSVIPTAPTGEWDITAKRIYRAATGASGTDLYFVAELPIATDTYSDSILDEALGDVLGTTDYYAPPDDMHSIGVLPIGIAFGFSKNQVCFSEPYLPHAWNPAYQIPTTHPIVGGGHFDNTVVAITEKNPYLLSGTDARTMVPYELNIQQGCMSKRSVVNSLQGVIYASPDGLFLIGPNGPMNLMEGFMLPEQWRELNPSSVLGVIFESKYFGFYDNGTEKGAFILDPKNANAGLTFIDVHATAAYADPLSDKLYLAIGSEVVAWNEGLPLNYYWVSKDYVSGGAMLFGAARALFASDGDLTFRFFVDGVERHYQSVNNDKAFRLPKKRGRVFKVSLEGNANISQVDIVESMSDFGGA